MNLPRVTLRPLRVTAINPGQPEGLGVSRQVCWAAGLREQERVEVRNETTGEVVSLRVQLGHFREVQVSGRGDFAPGHMLAVTAFHPAEPKTRGCTVCLCDRNQVIEIRDASAPRLVGTPIEAAAARS